MNGDGRLDLDDLGAVINDAAPQRVGDSRDDVEVIDDGRGRTWGDRLAEAGVTPWLHRHRVVLASCTAVVVLVGGAATAYVRLRPPPLDPEVRVTISDAVAGPFTNSQGQFVTLDTPGIVSTDAWARAAYAVSPLDPRDTSTYTVLGLSGPAVRASTAREQVAGAAAPAASDVDVILDCFDPAALSPAPGSYRLRVARTDSVGRTVEAALPLPDTSVSWPNYVASACTQSQTWDAVTVRSLTVRPAASTTVELALQVVNSLPLDVSARSVPTGGFPSVVAAVEPTVLPAGSETALVVRLDVRDCVAPALYPIGTTHPSAASSNGATVPGIHLTLTHPAPTPTASGSGFGDDPGGFAAVTWSPAQARQIDSALRQVCAGVPAPTAVVAAVGRGAPSTAVVPGLTRGSGIAFPLTLTVRAAGDRVSVSSPKASEEEYVGSTFAPATALVRDGVATVRTTWTATCDAYLQLPVLRVLTSSPRGDRPFRLTLTSPLMAQQVLAACPGLLAGDLTSAGWQLPPSA